MMEQEYRPAYPGGKVKAFTMSYDDGVDSDIRLVEIMRKNGIRGSFNLNSGTFSTEPDTDPRYAWHKMTMQQCVELYGEDMEIAVHGFRHCHWGKMPTAQAIAEILDDRRNLERMTGKPVRGAALPYNSFSDDVRRILELAEFRYCRGGKGRGKLEICDPEWICFQPTCHHKDPKLMEYAAQLIEAQVDYRSLYLMCVAGHSYEFVVKDDWHIIEELLEAVGNHEDIWYTTSIEFVEYLDAVKQLTRSEDGTMLVNPTNQDVWVQFEKQKRILHIPAHSTVTIEDAC